MQDPKLLDEPPTADRITDYDRAHLKTYLRLLDANADGADWQEVVEVVLGLDPKTDTQRARRVYAAHLARAKWMSEKGYRHLLNKDLH